MSESIEERLQQIEEDKCINIDGITNEILSVEIELHDYSFIVGKLTEKADENKRLREALEFYADPASYETNVIDQWEPVVPVNKDSGDIARKALEGK